MIKEDEQIVLGTWLRGERMELIDLFEEEDFTTYKRLFRAMSSRHKEGSGFDVIELSKLSGVERINILKLIGMSEIDFEGCCMNIKRGRAERVVRAGNFATDEYNSVVELTEKLQTRFAEVNIDKEDIAVKYIEELDMRAERKPVLTNLRMLDGMLGGLRQGELTCVGARPGVGKSAFCLQIAEEAARQGKKVLFFALEMSKFELLDRLAVKNTSLTSSKLRMGATRFSETEAHEFAVFLDGALKTFTDNVTIETGIANIDLYKSIIVKEKPDLVIIDQLSCLRTTKDMEIRQRFCYCTTLLKRISIECNIPVLLAAQIGRAGDSRRPTMSDFKESGSIEEDADNAILMSLTETTEESDQRNVLCDLAKHRQGMTGAIGLIFVPKKVRFYEVSK